MKAYERDVRRFGFERTVAAILTWSASSDHHRLSPDDFSARIERDRVAELRTSRQAEAAK